jgi:Vacuolar sorting protein 9 (VPS9) domain
MGVEEQKFLEDRSAF